MDASGNDCRYYLGIDSSTSGCTVVILEATETQTGRLIDTVTVKYDDLPMYATKDGIHLHEDGQTVTQHPIMWIDALERCLDKLQEQEFPFGEWLFHVVPIETKFGRWILVNMQSESPRFLGVDSNMRSACGRQAVPRDSPIYLLTKDSRSNWTRVLERKNLQCK